VPPGSSSTIVVHAPLTGGFAVARSGHGRAHVPADGEHRQRWSSPPNGAAQFTSLETRLPAQWRGAGSCATRPVLVEVKRDNGQTYDAYLSGQDTGTELILPWVKSATRRSRHRSGLQLHGHNHERAGAVRPGERSPPRWARLAPWFFLRRPA
jgi:hypothetical protein